MNPSLKMRAAEILEAVSNDAETMPSKFQVDFTTHSLLAYCAALLEKIANRYDA